MNFSSRFGRVSHGLINQSITRICLIICLGVCLLVLTGLVHYHRNDQVDKLDETRVTTQINEEQDRQTMEALGFLVDNMCMESYPCQHFVTHKDGKRTSMSGETIAEHYLNAGLPVPDHFKIYIQ
jgi:hypothetical protein